MKEMLEIIFFSVFNQSQRLCILYWARDTIALTKKKIIELRFFNIAKSMGSYFLDQIEGFPL